MSGPTPIIAIVLIATAPRRSTPRTKPRSLTALTIPTREKSDLEGPSFYDCLTQRARCAGAAGLCSECVNLLERALDAGTSARFRAIQGMNPFDSDLFDRACKERAHVDTALEQLQT
jgi:hypothetical protein